MKIHDIVQENSIWHRIKSGLYNLGRAITNAIKRLSFGQQQTFMLGDYMKSNTLSEVANIDKNKERERFDLTSMIGYLNEYLVASKLAASLESVGIRVHTNVNEGLEAWAVAYKAYILDNILKFEKPNKVAGEVKRAEDGSSVMSDKIFSEISQAHDIKLIDVYIDLTGQSREEEQGKEDVKITIKKRDSKKIVEMIKASLKLYKTPSGINVYNSTFASYLVTVVTGKEAAGTGDRAIRAFLQDHPEFAEEIEQVLAITKEWTKIKTDLKKKGSKDYRKAANKFITENRGYQKMRDLLFKRIFEHFYSTDKEAINKRVLERLGLDGADDVYLLVGTKKQQMIAVSSRTSEEFKRLYENLKRSFNIRYDIPDNPDVVSCAMVIESEDGEELARFTISFKEGATFPHMWSMTDIVNDARKQQRK